MVGCGPHDGWGVGRAHWGMRQRRTMVEGHEEDKERPEGIEEQTAKERCCRV